MPKVRIESTPVQVFYLGLFGFDHLMLTFQQLEAEDNGPQNVWYVMEGVRETGAAAPVLGVDGSTGQLTLAESYAAYGSDLTAVIGTPQDRGSRVLLTGLDALDSWYKMASFARDIDEQRLPYLGTGFLVTPTLNSSSVVASLLNSAGLDIAHLMPATVRFSPGTTTLIGTMDDDAMAIFSEFTTLVGGDGRDVLAGDDDLSSIDKLYGGKDDDKLNWSAGLNIMHGGLTGEDLVTDGDDTLDYTGVGYVVIDSFAPMDSHYLPSMIAHREDGTDWLFSVERFEWSGTDDTLIARGNLRIVRDDRLFRMGGESEEGKGDSTSFEGEEDSMLIAPVATGTVFALAEGSASDDTGIWIESVEWLVGSAQDDRIYAPDGLRGAEGGTGNDLVDGRLIVPFSGDSPLGYDVELYGGAGDDILVSAAGRSVACGGGGADQFVLSAFSSGAGVVELVIADADASDRVLVPYDMLKAVRGDFEGSALFPLLGAMGYPGAASFADLPENEGLLSTSTDSRSDFFVFEWQTQAQIWTFDNPHQGVIEFTGAFLYNREGSDLIIHAFLGGIEEITEIGHDEKPWTHLENYFEPMTETIIRVKDFQDGDLGIYFYDPGVPGDRDIMTEHGNFAVFDYPNWDAAVTGMTGGGYLYEAIEERPDVPTPPGDDTSMQAKAALAALALSATAGTAGNDVVTAGSGDDTLDGGAGADTLSGGSGNDVYIVDDAGDTVQEEVRAGSDTVRASVSYVLPENVEHLEIEGRARNGTGNAADNGLTGNDEDNLLIGFGGIDALLGLAGDDTLVGGDGNDIYYYRRGDGNDVIRDDGAGGGADILFFDGIAPGDIRFLRPASSPDDLVLVFEVGGRILIEDFFATPAGGIETVMMGEETIGRAAIEQALAGLPLTANEAPVAVGDTAIGMRAGSVLIPFAMLTGNDSDFEDDALRVSAVCGAVAGVTVALEAEGVRVTTGLGYSGPADFTYTLSDSHGGTDTAVVEIEVLPNHAPIVSGTIADVGATGGERFSTALPDTLFSDPDGDRLGLTARLASGGALPSWLTFDPAKATFSGTPPPSLSARLDIVVTATDGAASVSTDFRLAVEPGRHQHMPGRVITGDGWANGLAGTAGDDRIEGRGGSDFMAGLAGDDVFIVCGTLDGCDVFVGGAGYDIIRGSSRADTIRLAHASVNLDGIERIDGKGGRDVLAASAKGDHLDLSLVDVRSIECIDLGAGNDRFAGSAGRDVVKGGAGADVFRLGPASGRDVILDFVSAHAGARHDRLDLRAADFSSFSEVLANAYAMGDDTVLSLSSTSSVRLVGVSLSDLGAADVII